MVEDVNFCWTVCVGTRANDNRFQAYLVEGITWWNPNRAADAERTDNKRLCTYSGELQYGVDHLVWSVLGSPVLGFQCPPKYTGERFFNLLCCIFSCCCLCLIGDLHRICILYRKLKKSLHLNKQFPCLALTGLFSFSSFLISYIMHFISSYSDQNGMSWLYISV